MTIPRCVVLCALGFGAALRIAAQAPAQPDPAKPAILIEGVVLDKDSGTPIPGAHVLIQPTVFSPGTQFQTVTADEQGRFEARPPAGQAYFLHLQASGYAENVEGQRVSVAGDQQIAHVELRVTRLGSVRGVLADGETRKPLAGFKVEAVPRGSTPVRAGAIGTVVVIPAGFSSAPVVSQADGSFLLEGIPAAEFFLRITSDPSESIETIPAKDLAGDARDKALEAPEGTPGHGLVYWPGVDADMPLSPGLKVTGGTLDVGEIRLERRKLHNLTGVLNGCDPGASMQLLLAPPTRLSKSVDHDLVCGEGFRILNLPDGSFTLSAVQAGPPRRFAFQLITTATRGPLAFAMSAVIPVEMNVELEGVAPQDTPAELKNVTIEIQAESAPVRISAPSRTAGGEFEADLFPGLRYLVSLRPPPKYYLKRLSYNGVDFADTSGFTAYGGVLRFILSDRPGTLAVKIGGASTPAGIVIPVKDGMSYAETMNMSWSGFRQPPRRGETATIQGLSPGHYRVFLSSSATPSQESFEDSLRNAVSVTIEEGQTTTIDLQTP